MGDADLLDRAHRASIDGRTTPGRCMVGYGHGVVAQRVAHAVGARDIVQALGAACAGGNYAIGCAADLIRSGRADLAIAGGADPLARLQFAGMVRLGAIAADRCRPFDRERSGTLLGEGAAFLVLESEQHADARGSATLAEVGGFKVSCDAYHVTRPRPDGAGIAHAVRSAIRASGIRPADVDLVNTRGTGTEHNDLVECAALRAVFGDRPPVVTSIKSVLGHAMAAASALEAASCVEGLRHQLVPPTLHHRATDPRCGVEVVANTPAPRHQRIVVNNSLAFGGYDAAVVFAAPGALRERAVE